MTIISIEHVSHRYDTTDVLHDISLKVNDGGKLAMLGASGSGKTTLLRIIAGIETPTRGNILYDDVPLNDIDMMHRNIGMVFQNYALLPHWESRRTIGFFLSLRQRTREIPERVRKVAAITGIGLDRLLERKPSQLSGGEKQQVAIARAFARDLNVLLLDEPFANLDAKLRSTARLELQRLLSEFPITTIMVTHDQSEASALGDGVLLLNEGRIAQFGSFNALRDDPDTLYVAQFIGQTPINVFEGVARAGLWQGALLGGFPLPAPMSDGTPVTLAVHANHLSLAPEGVLGAVLVGTVTEVTLFFSQKYQVLEVARDAVHWRIEAPLDVQVRANDHITCRPDPTHLLFFTAEGVRLRAETR